MTLNHYPWRRILLPSGSLGMKSHCSIITHKRDLQLYVVYSHGVHVEIMKYKVMFLEGLGMGLS